MDHAPLGRRLTVTFNRSKSSKKSKTQPSGGASSGGITSSSTPPPSMQPADVTSSSPSGGAGLIPSAKLAPIFSSIFSALILIFRREEMNRALLSHRGHHGKGGKHHRKHKGGKGPGSCTPSTLPFSADAASPPPGGDTPAPAK